MSFDLNIFNYQKKELEEIFELPDIYDKNIVEQQEKKIKDSILFNNKISPDVKSKTIEFLNDAKKVLIDDVIEGVKSIKKSIENFYHSNSELKPTDVEDESGHMVQERKNTPFLSSFPSDFFPGVINPLKKRTTRQNLNIDSRFRDNYFGSQASNFSIDLPINFHNIVTIQLTAIELPSSFFVISKQLGNNFFTISLPDTNQSEVITVPDGNYEYQDLMDYINNSLINLGGNYQYIYFSANINSTTKSGSGNVIIGLLNNQLFPFTINFQCDKYGIEDRNTPLPLKFGWLLGFRNGIYINNYTYVSEGIIDLYGPKYAYLIVDDYNNNVNNGFYSAFNSSLLNKNILARISLQNSRNLSVISQNNFSLITFPRNYFGPVNIQKLQIQLLDEYGRIMDLNNMDFSFCLTLQTTYDL